MNILIFAGGAGTRLWPLSRKNSPKQFGFFKDGQSTLQMTMTRVNNFGRENIFIITNEQYKDLVKKQIPEIVEDHILTEPCRRDLAAAVGLTLVRLKKSGATGSAAIIWSDHFVDHPQEFESVLNRAEELVSADPTKIIFFGEKPRFANHNLGWIKLGEQSVGNYRSFAGWKYRPEKSLCDTMFASGEWLWNPGYFVFDLDTMIKWYQDFQPELWRNLEIMASDEVTLNREYKNLPTLSFDEAIIEHLSLSDAVVMPVNLGWSDPGTLYALKEALSPKQEDNFLSGNILVKKTRDSLVYNEESQKKVVTIGLAGIVVVNTPDALLVCHKDFVPEIKNVLKELEDAGEEKYL
ncbi:MAG: hypothetical protein A2821_04415 [Candidatus Magasanikbacteria bacterium RIFCSPHIGHO2_01_FULL_41_23]|uniref:Nucleotidyl transferase domain-containing protein n=1 Tax=Candidatus Magasanikbacteria bacterium RIFCSPLOWO2_01_FULL_40_15 TaxID=1798686 RepID=A0A1F6N3Y5_9BACT|nr:MAG: hypothetical protein A2821_04415 [Candidatus Magasanikbacteria bacterium RIFCSPHIGHO2_01_FULL_41_23]OGH67169.1 MAG: hypothetical protein A3C66_02730 [Candidatus Magasanikbacteria bacterium RIFCSPHIGHO2_02_FULL_41_35]OGH75466.1 MAG: hypothetical protein A3F22_01415 [Candidatus Magasanikbacteria bacterium RIFCSPHIGHO2_12_FULL_41_16]OGH78706.1 MAG: hypothetical protein A2983_04370 [Candidatus Magasanikbacteria bacterium RIFCSPLOWO2_01_FULL_40_15]